MAASIIDALVITLGLDTSDYDSKRKSVGEGMKDAREDAEKTAKEMETQGKKAASFFSSIKTELLALAGVSLTIGGLTSFVKNTTHGLMDLSIQSKALGLSAQSLDGWTKAAEAAGSSAEKITGTLGNFQNAIQAFKSGDAPIPMLKALALLNADTGGSVRFDLAKQSPEELLKGVSKALQQEKSPDRARYIAKILGIDDATLQSMRSGQFVGNADRYSKSSQISDQSVKASQEFTKVATDLGQNLNNLKNDIYTSLIPSIRDLNGVMVDWSKNTGTMSSFWKTFKTDVNEITGINLSNWTLGEDLNNLKTNLLEFGSSITHLGNALNALNNGEFSKAGDELKKAWYGTENGAPNGKDALPGVTREAQKQAGESDAVGTYKKLNNTLNKILPEWLGGTPAQKQHQSNEKDYWDSSKDSLSKIANVLVSPAGAADRAPNMGGYQSNVSLNPVAAKLGPKGKALLNMMAGEFGQLEGKYGLPEGLLRSVAATESGGDPYAKSKAGAQGLFQFMPGTAKDVGLNGSDVNDPHKSAEAAARYLSQLLKQTGGDLNSALAAYNWGIGNVQKKGLENAPQETRDYVPKVLGGLRPGSGMAVENRNPSASGSSQTEYHIGSVTVSSPAQSVSRLTEDISKRAQNRVRILAFNSGQQ